MNKLRILHIEDNALQRRELCKLLRDRGFIVRPATSGATGLAFLRKGSFDIVICDLNMPRMGGMTVLKRAQKIAPETPVIIMTAHGTIQAAVKAIKLGAYNFVLKPVEIDEIDTLIHQAHTYSIMRKKLKQSETMLNTLIEAVPDTIYSLDSKGRFLSLSRAAEQTLGYKPKELIGKSVFHIIFPDDRERIKKELADAQKSGGSEIKTLELRMVSKSGEVRDIEIRRRLAFENGRIIRNDGIARDITERKKLETQLKLKADQLEFSTLELARANVDMLAIQEQLEGKNAQTELILEKLSKNKDCLQAILDSSPSAIIMVDPDGKIIAGNKGIQNYFELNPEKLLGSDILDLFIKLESNFKKPADFKKLIKEIQNEPDCCDTEALDHQRMFHRSLRLIGTEDRYVSMAAVPVRDVKDQNIGMTWIFTDITAIRKADEQIHTIIDASPVPLIITRIVDGEILYANEHLGALVGFTADELIGKKSPDFYFNREDRNVVLESLKKDGYLKNHEVMLKKADGTPFWSIFSLVISEISGEQVIIGGIYDIDKRKQAEDKLKLYKEIFMNAGDGITIIDPDGKIIDRNPAHRKYSGFTDEELVGKSPSEFICNDSLIEVDKAINKGGRFRGEILIKSKQGDEIDVDLSLFPIRDDEGNLLYYAGMGRDISQKKSMERALRDSEERFRNLVENANDIIYSLSLDGKFSYVPPNWTAILGHEIPEVVGKSFEPFVHPDDLPACKEFFAKVAMAGEVLSGIEYRVKHKDGQWRWHVSNASPLRDEDGNIVAFVGVAHDITENKKNRDDLVRANTELKEAQTQLVQSEKMASLGMLVAGIAHEINTPIGAVNSMHNTMIRSTDKLKEILNTGQITDEQIEFQLRSILQIIDNSNQVIQSGTDRVINIVRRLKSFARLDEAELKRTDIHEGIDDTLTIIHHEIKHKATVIKNYGDIPLIPCYPGPLNQVFLNILINASQAIKGKGEIKITTRLEGTQVNIEITDTGSGISEDNLAKIFDPGFTTKGVGVGTGLGLSICYQIIHDHRGEIYAKSELGKGTVFKISLPLNLDELLGKEVQE
jgi:PAS domain S-box-containing protein